MAEASLQPEEDELRSLLERHQDILVRRLDYHEMMLKQLVGCQCENDRNRDAQEYDLVCPPSLQPSFLSGPTVQPTAPDISIALAPEHSSDAKGGALQNVEARTAQTPLPHRPTFLLKEDEDKIMLQSARNLSSNSLVSESNIEPELNWLCRSRRKTAIFVERGCFDVLIACLICSNALFMGIEVEYIAHNPGSAKPEAFGVIDKFYNFTFLMELVLKLFAFGGSFYTRKDWAWNCFDTFLVAYSVLEVLYDLILELSAGTGDTFAGIESMRTIRIIRMTKLARLTRITRVMKLLRSLRGLVNSIVATFRSLLWAWILLVGIMFVFGVVFTQAVGEYQAETGMEPVNSPRRKFFGTLLTSVFTLYSSIAGGISWYDVVVPLHEISFIYTLLFLAYIFFVTLAVMNVITGVFCSNAIEYAARDHETLMYNTRESREGHLAKLRSGLSDKIV